MHCNKKPSLKQKTKPGEEEKSPERQLKIQKDKEKEEIDRKI
jgi:hypothetical protein